MIEKRESELNAALTEAERKGCGLRAEREALEANIEALRQAPQPDVWLINERCEELALLNDRADRARVEMLSLRVELAKIELPRAQAAVGPRRKAFDESRAKYLAAAEECNRVGAESNAASFKVTSIESAIRYDEKTIEELTRNHLKLRAA